MILRPPIVHRIFQIDREFPYVGPLKLLVSITTQQSIEDGTTSEF